MKEQQKQHLIDMMKADEELGLYDETLEEAAKKYSNGLIEPMVKTIHYVAFKDGAKWQQERMYSEKDMLKSFMAGIKCESNKGENFEQFIKQFKKKKDYDTKREVSSMVKNRTI
jgi:hypothetical protein